MTISLHETVYEGLQRKVGRRGMSQFIENLLRPHVLATSLDDGYKAMAADKERESEASEWIDALARDCRHETR